MLPKQKKKLKKIRFLVVLMLSNQIGKIHWIFTMLLEQKKQKKRKNLLNIDAIGCTIIAPYNAIHGPKLNTNKKIQGKEKPLSSKKKNYILNLGFELKIHKFQFLAPHNELQTQIRKKKPYAYLTCINKFFNLRGGD
jgi:hypothetical protein